MAKTVVALFDTLEQAQRAAQDLIERGFVRDSISLVAGEPGYAAGRYAGDEKRVAEGTGAGAGGGVLGGVIGMLPGLGALAIPGIGPVIAAGPLAAAIGSSFAGAAVGAGIGGAVGGLLGALVGVGVTGEDAGLYAEGVRRGGALIVIVTSDDMASGAHSILQRHDAVDLDKRGAEWRQSGWNRFDQDADPYYARDTVRETVERGLESRDRSGTAAAGVGGAAIGAAGGPIGAVIGGVAGAATGAGVGSAGDSVGEALEDQYYQGVLGFDERADDRSARGTDAGDSGDEDPGAKSPTTSGEQARGATRAVERVASANFPPVVEPESENLLTYTIGKRALSASVAALQFDVPAGAQEATLIVSVQTSDFVVLDPGTGATRNWHRVTLNLENDQAEIDGEFLLRARPTTTRLDATIYLRFSHNGAPVGRIPLETVIAPQAAGTRSRRRPEATAAVRVSMGAAPGPDVVIHVTEHGDDRFQISVDRAGKVYAKPMGDFPTRAGAWKYAQSILEEFRMARALPPDQRPGLIDSLGLNLWWQLPEAFRDFYWEEMHGQDLSIVINSQEPYIPWELIKPQRERGGSETADMLGTAFAIGRWKDGRTLPDPLVVSDFVVIAPTYTQNPLQYTGDEAAELARQFGARRVDGTYAAVAALLRSNGVQTIHFAGHGRFDPSEPTRSEIALADLSLKPTHVSGATIGGTDRPLVFLNACEVGKEGWSLTQIGGWAEAFCDVGFSAFVGPYWAVNDLVAKKVSLLFYGALRAGQTVGHAIQAIRRRFWTDDEYRFHPTWLAYSLHCQPNVTVEMNKAT